MLAVTRGALPWLVPGATVAALAGLLMLRGEARIQDSPYTSWSDYGGSADSMQVLRSRASAQR